MKDDQVESPQRDPSETQALLQKISDGAAKVLENASDLYHEALLLRAAGALSRALTLHQISLEECAKIDMLGAWSAGKLMGAEQQDLKALASAFASHKVKNYAVAYLLPPTEAESIAEKEGSWREALHAFKEMQGAFHNQSNAAKNGSLYVDLQNGEFVAPKDWITIQMVEDVAARNERILAAVQLMSRMLRRWAKNPDQLTSMFSWFEPRLREMRSEGGDPREAMAIVMDELMERARSTGYAEAMVEPEEDGR